LLALYHQLIEMHLGIAESRMPEIPDTEFKSDKYLILNIILCLVLILILAMYSSLFLREYRPHYMLDKTITWADGSKEHIQIDDDGFFVLNGVKQRLVGMLLPASEMPFGQPHTTQFWLPGNLAAYDKALAYLESIGVRFIHVDMRYSLWWMPSVQNGGALGSLETAISEERQAYKSLLDLLYKHKMLVAPGIFGKWNTGLFDISKSLDYSFEVNDKKDTFSAWATRWIDAFSRYPNIVSVVAEQELDGPLGIESVNPPQEYTAADVEKYLNFLFRMICARIHVPIVHNLIGDLDMEEYRIEIKQVCLKMTDHPVFNFHQPSVEQLGNKLNDITSWLNQQGHSSSGWWCFELSKAYPPDNSHFTVEYIDTVFNHGASLVTLFLMYNELPVNNGWAFFDAKGNPKPQMVQIAKEIPRLQSPIRTPRFK
jgi:hypothetical protein